MIVGHVESKRPATPGQNFYINPFKRLIGRYCRRDCPRSKVPTGLPVFGKISLFLRKEKKIKSLGSSEFDAERLSSSIRSKVISLTASKILS